MGTTIQDVYIAKVKGANKLSYRLPEDMDGKSFVRFITKNNNKLKEIRDEQAKQ